MAGLGAASQSNAERGSAPHRNRNRGGEVARPGKPGWSHPPSRSGKQFWGGRSYTPETPNTTVAGHTAMTTRGPHPTQRPQFPDRSGISPEPGYRIWAAGCGHRSRASGHRRSATAGGPGPPTRTARRPTRPPRHPTPDTTFGPVARRRLGLRRGCGQVWKSIWRYKQRRRSSVSITAVRDFT